MTTPEEPCGEYEDKILFYRQGDVFGDFSNFAPTPIVVDGERFATTEHYFQAQKFVGTPYYRDVANASTASNAAKLGRSRAHPLRPDWEEVKDEVMMTALRAKFTQHQHLKDTLLGTAPKTLIEHTTNDRYWADGGDGSGKNMLGILLMKLRDELSQQ